NPRSFAYQFALKHPQEVYFPLDPIATLLSDGKMYHFDVGLFDMTELFHEAIPPAQLRDYIPAHLKYLAFETNNQFSAALFPEFRHKTQLPELPGWTVFTR
ncbi:MAG TPA: hypothetical protein VMU17_05375, partial [Elusimicrobiota bacterium]|nr:hypothetical protein [Elusimicrobiota bacterium]